MYDKINDDFVGKRLDLVGVQGGCLKLCVNGKYM